MVANACWWGRFDVGFEFGVICWWFGLVVGCVCSSWGSAACCVGRVLLGIVFGCIGFVICLVGFVRCVLLFVLI